MLDDGVVLQPPLSEDAAGAAAGAVAVGTGVAVSGGVFASTMRGVPAAANASSKSESKPAVVV